MEYVRTDEEMSQWHPAFFAGIRIEFCEEENKMYFENEHQLGTKPMQIDVLIIKKNNNEPLEKNIGRIFSKLIQHLTEVRGFTIEQYETGIYYIKGDIFPIQLIVTSKLSKEHNFWLKNLTDDLTDTEAVRELAREYQDKQLNILYRSVMNVIIKANEKLFKEECAVCEAIIDLFRDEYDEGIAKAKADGIQQGMREKILSLFHKGLLNLENAAEELNITVEEFEKMVKEEA